MVITAPIVRLLLPAACLTFFLCPKIVCADTAAPVRKLANKAEDGLPTAWGNVTGTDGKPVAGADIYAICYYPTGMQSGQSVLASKTDAAGGYQIPDLPSGDGYAETTVRLVVHQPGYPLAFGDGEIEQGHREIIGKDLHVDLVLPIRHTSLTVHALQDGEPLAGAPMELSSLDSNWVAPAIIHGADRGKAATALRELLTPRAVTGPDGTVTFTDLVPGLWGITVNRSLNYWRIMDTQPVAPFSICKNVAVRVGENQSYTVRVLPHEAIPFRILTPDGRTYSHPMASLVLTMGQKRNYGSLLLTPDGAGNGLGQPFEFGLLQATARFANTPLDGNALVGPYNEGTVMVAVSPAAPIRRPLVIPTQRIGPASLRVRFQDEHGKPIRGAVSLTILYQNATYAASADKHGVVVFPHMPLGKYTLTARLGGRPGRVRLGGPSDPFPSDAALLAGASQPLQQTVTLQAGAETVVTFRPQRLGYLRLRVTGADPATADSYSFDGRLPTDEEFLDMRLDPRTHEYLVGPMPSGRRKFVLFHYVPAPVDRNLSGGETWVTVEAGKIARATFTVHEAADNALLYSMPLSGTALMPDGKTPAWGARAALVVPLGWQPERMARADALGRLTLPDFWSSSRRWTQPLGSPAVPSIAVWLPGANGAAIVPYQPGSEMRIVLPPSITLHGRVTVGGQSAAGLPSSFRIRAAYQGRGNLNEVLSLEATAQADGAFELAGLTPGTYRVQAARDDIWLSSTQTLTVGTSVLPEMALDIAPPGAPVLLHWQDRQGRPLANREVKIARPAGPLTEEIWPSGLKTDRRGDLRVDGLEAGRHQLAEKQRDGEQTFFTVPAWTQDAPLRRQMIVRDDTRKQTP